MKKMLLFLSILLITSSSYAQYSQKVSQINIQPNKVVQVVGSLVKGEFIPDLSWAAKSSVACFPATQNSKFTGKHVLYNFTLPPYSEVSITLIPNDKNANMSLYGYQVGANNYSLPPSLNSCVSCEADYKWDRPKRGKTQDHTRNIKFNAIKNSYNIVIGVAGANGLKSGNFTIKVDLKSKNQTNSAQSKLKVYTADAQKGKVVAYKGDLADGVKIEDLTWASKSSVACFPATQNNKFTGNHIMYISKIPAHSEMFITVIPQDKTQNMSIYAYTIGLNNNAMVPDLNSCVSCEAEYKWDYPKKGKTQDHTRTVRLNAINNAYKVIIGVAGADGLADGKFILKIETK